MGLHNNDSKEEIECATIIGDAERARSRAYDTLTVPSGIHVPLSYHLARRPFLTVSRHAT